VITDPESGARYRGREYPWGTVNIEDQVTPRAARGLCRPQDHCDFMALRNLVLAHHMQDLKEVTIHSI
jgi:septin family protein